MRARQCSSQAVEEKARFLESWHKLGSPLVSSGTGPTEVTDHSLACCWGRQDRGETPGLFFILDLLGY